MSYIFIENLSHSYGDKILFDSVNLTVNKGDKIALVAKNGAGKSTLLHYIIKAVGEKDAITYINPHITVGYLEQEPNLDSNNSIYEEVFAANTKIVELLHSYNAAIQANDTLALESLASDMDMYDTWNYETKVQIALTKLGFKNNEQRIKTLSGGQKKRVALAKLLLLSPDLLILDEPTNHLDLDAIEWLEDLLDELNCTLLMVTHDRYFLDRVCNTIVEIDECKLYKYNGNYSYFLTKKEERREQELAEYAKAKNLYNKELEWMRRQPQARGTKAKYRIDAFEGLKERISKSADASTLNMSHTATRLGNKVFVLSDISKSIEQKVLIQNFSYTFCNDDRIAIIGANGSGKTTLLNILAQKSSYNSGSLEIGTTVNIGYYMQQGITFDDNQRVIEVIKDIAERITIAPNVTISATQYLEHWLFPPFMHYVQVGKLSGGEKKRLYLMTVLMQQPNVLILDEPTNDLDLQTLQILEEFIAQFQGCVIIVSHDRFFTDKIARSLLVFSANGTISPFMGSYSEYRAYEKFMVESAAPAPAKLPVAEKPQAEKSKRKLSYKEQQELQKIESELPILEEEKELLEQQIISVQNNPDDLHAISLKIAHIIDAIDAYENRWLELQDSINE